ncbi:Transcriptional regulator, LysR family [hydrothermal vent metagenome]|uniref:Transcriptional regulator, LysR family n=1 Tax=hydrothermal vent metagenome TaxID=652676 RepID=A0A3B0TFI4_9ZZZZ
MRYVQLRAFHHVAICGGFSRAAAALGLTQPAISDQVKKLEMEYDVHLLDRRKGKVTVTGSGRRLLEITRHLFEVESQAAEFLSRSRDLRSGALRIIADSAHHLLPILGRFRAAYPGIEITMASGNSEKVIAGLTAYQADIGVYGGAPDGDRFKVVKLSSTPLIAFASPGHEFGHRASITLAELLSQPLVLREAGSKTRQKLAEAAARRGLVPKAAIEAEGREAVQQIVSAGAGLGVVSAAEFGTPGNLAAIEISDCEILMDEALICLAERADGKLVRTFFELARQSLAMAD